MEGRKASLMCFFLAGFVVSQVLARSLEEGGLGEQKNYYSPDPHGSNSHHTSSHSRPSCACPTPSHGGGSGHTPSHGGGYNPTPTPILPPPSQGGGGYTPTPTPILPPPSHGGGGCGTPSTPSHGGSGGGYYAPPTTPIISTPPSPVVVPVTPTPVISAPPSTPVDPNSPPPFLPAPCSYWISHPGAIWAIFGYWAPLGNLFGPTVTTPFGGNPSILQALGNTRMDGIGALYREGTAALLNSMASRRFAYTTQQVRDSFMAATASDKAAGAQAKLFKLANEGHPVKH